MGNLAQRFSTEQAPQDPKLKIAAVGSQGARAAAEKTVSTGDVAELRKLVATLTARVAALEVNSHVPVDFGPMLDRIAALEGVTPTVTPVTPVTARDVTPRNARGAADRQKAFRERQKAKRKA